MDKPRPVTTSEAYLAAILDEIQALRQAVCPTDPAPAIPAPAEEVPKRRGRKRARTEPGHGGVVDPGLDLNVGSKT